MGHQEQLKPGTADTPVAPESDLISNVESPGLSPTAAPVEALFEQHESAAFETPRRFSGKVISGQRNTLVENVLDNGESTSKAKGNHANAKKKKGAFSGVFVPTCENMWGVLIFLRFYFIVGHAGVGQAIIAVLLSFCCAFCTTSSMSAIVSSGGIVSKGGPYYMISRALGPCVGASVGIMYWLAFTILAVLECLGAVESLLMAAPQAAFTFCQQAYGSALILTVTVAVYGGINIVTKLGIVFAAVVFFTIFMYYFGLATAPRAQGLAPLSLTGLDLETFKVNWGPHYGPGVNFGYVLGVFFPCFTGILSGANRADILKDPPKNIKQGTFGAIIFSLLMYTSFMVLWGMVAEYDYLQGKSEVSSLNATAHALAHAGAGRRLAGGIQGANVVQEIVWNPFPHAAEIGIIISSTSQALQCMVVAPRLLQSIAQDEILSILKPLAPLRRGEPKRALLATYIVAALLMLIGKLDLVAPLLSMCFLVAYAFMNFSCFALTWLRSPAWRPKGVQHKRWRVWYIGTAFCGLCSCLAIMFIIDYLWALAAIIIGLCLYCYVNWKVEARGWGSAVDGIRYQLALTSLIQLEGSQRHAVNWRPQVLILYRLRLEDLQGSKEHGLLSFYSQLRKGSGFCVVACVLEADPRDESAHQKACVEKGVIRDIMKQENISGFAEVVVSPSWVEGTNYIIQLTGLGGLSPNTVLLDWPEGWRRQPDLATDFVSVLRTALAKDKAVLAIRGLQDMPVETVYGTIDIWWMIHDGGFLILLSWLLVQHKVWRKCHLRVFTITEGVTEEQAKAAAQRLTKTLRQRRLFDVDVEVILADDAMIEPYTYDWTLRVEDRHRFLHQLQRQERVDLRRMQGIPLAIDDLFAMEDDARIRPSTTEASLSDKGAADEELGHIAVSDIRTCPRTGALLQGSTGRAHPTQQQRAEERRAVNAELAEHAGGLRGVQGGSGATAGGEPPMQADLPPRQDHAGLVDASSQQAVAASRLDALFQKDDGLPRSEGSAPASVRSSDPSAARLPRRPSTGMVSDGAREVTGFSQLSGSAADAVSFQKLNQIIHSRSKRAQLVVMNLPDLRCDEPEEVHKFMSYCDTLTMGLERVLFVHASGHEIFDLSA